AFVCPIPTSAHTNYLINLLKSVLSEADVLAFRLKRAHILSHPVSKSTLFFNFRHRGDCESELLRRPVIIVIFL
ncbi:hypothetical protein, partial [Marinobacterium nitratireducens]|uniref:hypothetical protein n=1 Tax=Marinobacterium nitratireducens TaxID=518897 RepID=UPI001E53036F